MSKLANKLSEEAWETRGWNRPLNKRGPYCSQLSDLHIMQDLRV